jgi:hypothetical protein
VVKPENGAAQQTAVKKKKMSEVDKLLGDEGAINMIYELERENKNTEVKEVQQTSDDNDTDILNTKAKMIRNAVIKQSTSPTNASASRFRVKRAPTPVKAISPPTKEAEKKSPELPVKEPAKKSPETAGKKAPVRKRKLLGSSEWDYVYKGQKDDAMIIRRRSNSSYSSSSSTRRMSFDQPPTNQDEDQERGKINTDEAFEFLKPDTKAQKSDVVLDAALVANIKGKLSKVLSKRSEDMDEIEIKKTSPKQKRKLEEESPPVVKKRASEIGLVHISHDKFSL